MGSQVVTDAQDVREEQFSGSCDAVGDEFLMDVSGSCERHVVMISFIGVIVVLGVALGPAELGGGFGDLDPSGVGYGGDGGV